MLSLIKQNTYLGLFQIIYQKVSGSSQAWLYLALSELDQPDISPLQSEQT